MGVLSFSPFSEPPAIYKEYIPDDIDPIHPTFSFKQRLPKDIFRVLHPVMVRYHGIWVCKDGTDFLNDQYALQDPTNISGHIFYVEFTGVSFNNSTAHIFTDLDGWVEVDVTGDTGDTGVPGYKHWQDVKKRYKLAEKIRIGLSTKEQDVFKRIMDCLGGGYVLNID